MGPLETVILFSLINVLGFSISSYYIIHVVSERMNTFLIKNIFAHQIVMYKIWGKEKEFEEEWKNTILRQ